MKIALKLVMILCLIAGLIGFSVFDAAYIAPSRFTVRYETLSSEEIGEQLDGMKICFFSDLDYGTYMDEKRLNKLVETINAQAPDVILFGGDLYDQNASITAENSILVAEALNSMSAEYGKFAVTGDFDCADEVRKTTVSAILDTGGFEVISNRTVNLHRSGSESIALTGLENGLNGTEDIDNVYASVPRNTYQITMVHTPDTADSLPSDLVDYCLAGHSLGGEIYLFFTSSWTPAMAANYFRGMHTVNGAFTLDITTGVGTTEKDMRFMADPEIVIYTLESNAEPEETAETVNEENTESSETAAPAETQAAKNTETTENTETSQSQ